MYALLAALSFSLTARAGDVATFRRQLIQGDVKAALQTASTIPADALAAKDAAAIACMGERFAAPPVAASGKAAAVLDAYRIYWHAVLLAPASRSAAEARLLATLDAILPGTGWDRHSLGDTAQQARRFVEAQGLHALTGVTSPNYELMVWRGETAQTYQVALPDQLVSVRVVFLDDFLSKGWLSYASCDRFGAGGWTAQGVLYALAGKYDTASEDFKVSYLGHEGQHFADNVAFPQLAQSELEYRAKLTELVLASDPARLFERFAQTAQPGRAAPHAHAEYWLVRRLRERLAEASSANDLHGAARSLLAESSAQARTAGALTVTRLLPD